MSRYLLVDNDENVYSIKDETFKLLTDVFSIEVDVIEKSFRSGADFPGIQRDESKEQEYVYDINTNNEIEFRDYVNTVTMQLRKCTKIRDTIRQKETEVLYTGQNIGYDEGGFLYGAKINVTFTQLRPYWEDITYNSELLSGTVDQLIINNTGYIETPPIITITALEPITKFSMRIIETGAGMVIRDLQFGLLGLETYIIDCKEGTAELSQILRNQKIQSNTGFFNLQVGTNTFVFEANGSANVEVIWKNRSYI